MNPVAALADGITCIDTEQLRPGMACCYLLQRGADVALIECGTAPGARRLLGQLRTLGVAPEQVRYLIPTHVHLDHAGAAGTLMQALPNATLLAHPRAAPHLADPARLIDGARAVYGAGRFAQMYGEVLPVNGDRIQVMEDGASVELGPSRLHFLDTPGHARHHFCIWDPCSQGFFTGDSFGLSYRELDSPEGPFILPTTTPVQFEPDAWQQTLQRLMSFAPRQMFLTHYGPVGHVAALADELSRAIDEYREIALRLSTADDRNAALVDALEQEALVRLRGRRISLGETEARALLHPDLKLNAQGLEVWLDRASR